MIASNTQLHHSARRPSLGRRAGLSLVEAMIALAIAATLLTAVSAAFTSTAKAMEINDDFFRATQAARVSLVRMLAQVRCGIVNEKNTSGVVFADNTTLNYANIIYDVIKPDGTVIPKNVTYRYDSASSKIIMVTNDSTTDPDYTLAQNVSDCKFVIGIGEDANHSKCVSQVSISIVVNVGGNTVRLSGSAAPRRTLKY